MLTSKQKHPYYVLVITNEQYPIKYLTITEQGFEHNIVICQWEAKQIVIFTQERSQKGESVVSFTHEQNIICSQTQLEHKFAQEQTILCRSLGRLSANERKKNCIQ